ncbi:hypothetical protein PYW08_015101 [Mythimna loreyi]|uniref:Uncharacterized protein n=1 Tax=Mythimna loreyi TaxID=667449 RepID=A0ACC2QZU7_9NEOP|nr:hypothetical protein PYW08_015101 [Mythimna loreyi]
MNKKLSARTKALVSACLQNSSDDEDENHSGLALPYADTNRLSKHEIPTDEVSGEKSVELLFSGMGCSRYFNIRSHEDGEEKSIEPPPYSPLTPRPLSNHNVIMHEKQSTNPSPNFDQYNMKLSEPHVTLHENIAEKRITPMSCPVSPRPNQSTLSDPPSSPVRSMSPETAKIFNILTEELENDGGASENMFNVNENNPIVSPASSDRTEVIFDDDDSVQDPDFVGESYTGGSDNSSGVSESLITSLPDLFYETNTDENETQTSSRSNQILQENISEATRSPSSRPKRGRKRKYGDLTREERKKRKYQNLPYVNSRKQRIEPKPFLDYNCNCPKKCQEKISRENSKKLKGSEEEKAMLDSAHREHLQKAKALQQQLKNDMQLAKEDRFTETITFDLQKTLPLPRIPTNIVFYKRQLWVYNLGIHSGSDDQAYCNVWVEDDAQEYYKKLSGNSTVQDDIDGFSGTVDFEVEVEDAA